MECFRCKKDVEQLLTIDQENLKMSMCFPCVVKCLRDYKRKTAEKLMKDVMGLDE